MAISIHEPQTYTNVPSHDSIWCYKYFNNIQAPVIVAESTRMSLTVIKNFLCALSNSHFSVLKVPFYSVYSRMFLSPPYEDIFPKFFSCTNINCDLWDTTEAQDAKNLTVKKREKKNSDRLFLAQPQALDYFSSSEDI